MMQLEQDLLGHLLGSDLAISTTGCRMVKVTLFQRSGAIVSLSSVRYGIMDAPGIFF